MITEERAQSLASERQPSIRKGRQSSHPYVFPPAFEIAVTEGSRASDPGSAAYVAEWNRVIVEQLGLVEQERQRIAADLHDGLGQSLCLLARSLRNLASVAAARGTESIDQQLGQITRNVDGMLADLRRTAMNLRPSMLDDLGLVATLSWFLRDVESSCPGLEVQRRVDVKESEVPDDLKTPIFRIIQEAFANAIKHASAARLELSLRKRYDSLVLIVRDDGKGFETPKRGTAQAGGAGFGLRTMQARAEGSCGRFRIRSAPGQGTVVQVEWTGVYTAVPKV